VEAPITVLLVDDHQMFREGIRRRLEQEQDIKVVGEASSAREALERLTETNPSIVILDIRLPDTSGIELAKRLRQQRPEVKIIVLSGYDFDQYVRALVRVGIEAYLLKDASQDNLVDAVREVNRGGVVLPPVIASKVVKAYARSSKTQEASHVWELTVREVGILEMLHQGLRNAEMAERLGISPRTVESHVGSIIAKLGARNRIEAVRIAEERRFIR